MARILVLDDNGLISDLIKEELALAGHTVSALGDAELAGDAVDRFGPDLLILDLYMNRRDRWDILARVKDRFPNLPVIIHSAYEGYRQDPRALLADGFVLKSASLERLKENVRCAVRGSTFRPAHRRARARNGPYQPARF